MKTICLKTIKALKLSDSGIKMQQILIYMSVLMPV